MALQPIIARYGGMANEVLPSAYVICIIYGQKPDATLRRRVVSTEGVERLNIRMPRELTDELKRLVPARKRNQLIVAATAEAVARLRQQEALREERIWSDESHPDLTSQEDINRYLSEMRAPWERPAD